MHPAQPVPESLPPRNPGLASAASTSASSASRTVLEVVAAGSVRRRNQAAEFLKVAGSQGDSPLANPLVLAQHVPGALAAHGIKPVPVLLQICQADIAQRLTASAPRFVWK